MGSHQTYIACLISIEDHRVDIVCLIFFFQAEDGIRDLVRSRGLGDVYKRQVHKVLVQEYPTISYKPGAVPDDGHFDRRHASLPPILAEPDSCLLYTSDAADERSSVDLGGRRIIQKKK